MPSARLDWFLFCRNEKSPLNERAFRNLAEREGFEPPVVAKPRLISSQVH